MVNLGNHLQAGQSVCLQELTWGYQVTVQSADQPGTKIAEVDNEFVVFDNESSGIRTRVPSFMIKTITPLPGATLTPTLAKIETVVAAATEVAAIPAETAVLEMPSPPVPQAA